MTSILNRQNYLCADFNRCHRRQIYYTEKKEFITAKKILHYQLKKKFLRIRKKFLTEKKLFSSQENFYFQFNRM